MLKGDVGAAVEEDSSAEEQLCDVHSTGNGKERYRLTLAVAVAW